MSKKIRILALGDTPTCATGFAQVMRNILKVLNDTGKYEIDVIGINYDGSPYDREKHPYNIYPAINALRQDPRYSHDPYGLQLFLDRLGTGEYDLVFVLQDTFIIKKVAPLINKTRDSLPPENRFKWIYYYPIDATPNFDWIDEGVNCCDYPVVYTNYGYNESLKVYSDLIGNQSKKDEDRNQATKKYESLKNRLEVIYHGTNTKDFYPIKDVDHRELKIRNFGEQNADKFIFINVNRNQQRKDIARSMMAIKLLRDLRRSKGKDDVYAYFHCQVIDGGFNLIDIGKQIGLTEGDDYCFPNPAVFNASQGFTLKQLNECYNACDAVISTTLGEGWGLSLTEGMSIGKPVVFPANTSVNEILGESGERGFKVKCGDPEDNLELMHVSDHDNSRLRPLTDIHDMVKKMDYIMDNPEKVKKVTERAYKFAKKYEWGGDSIGKRWLSIFEKAYNHKQFEEDYFFGRKEEIGRNDVHPFEGVKFKKSKHYERLQNDQKTWVANSSKDGESLDKSR